MDGDYRNLMSVQFTGVALSRTAVERTSHQDQNIIPPIFKL